MNRMWDFHSKEIKSKVFSRFTDWMYKSTKYVSILWLIHKIEISSKLYENVDDLFIILIGEKHINTQGWKDFLNYFRFFAAIQILLSANPNEVLKRAHKWISQ